jgi:hypothetical protein
MVLKRIVMSTNNPLLSNFASIGGNRLPLPVK